MAASGGRKVGGSFKTRAQIGQSKALQRMARETAGSKARTPVQRANRRFF